MGVGQGRRSLVLGQGHWPLTVGSSSVVVSSLVSRHGSLVVRDLSAGVLV